MTFDLIEDVQVPILAVVAFDIVVEGRDVGDLAKDFKQGGTSSLAAVVMDSERPREVWFGKTIEQKKHSAQLTVELPGLIKSRVTEGFQTDVNTD